jgi:hypothetical protein
MSESNDALSALKAFMKAMSAWERESSQLIDKVEEDELDLDEVETQQMESLRRIQDMHCADTKWRRSEFNVTSPPEYDLRGNKILDIKIDTPGIVYIEMRQQHLADGVMKIQISQVDGKWKVVRRWIKFQGKKPIASQL